jgi:photosystem II stability/assembly factor-like uncharacterized protein
VDEVSLRSLFHSALDEVAPPKPWLADVVRDELRRLQPTFRKRRRFALWTPGLRRAIAAVLIVVVAGAAAAGAIAIYGHTHGVIPVLHPPVPPRAQYPSTWECAGYTAPAGSGPLPVKVASATTLWATGGLRSTDGGARWADTSPAGLRSDEPSGLARSQLPPGFSDFYLDADHAWLARAVNYGSTSSCYDHVVIYSTSNGGASWQQSGPIAIATGGDPLASPVPCKPNVVFSYIYSASTAASPSPSPTTCPTRFGIYTTLFFVDSGHGWMTLSALGAHPSVLYGTSDGGRKWRVMGNPPGPCPIVFTSLKRGWVGPGGPVQCGLMRTDDAGATWQDQTLPCDCSVPYDMPLFHDQSRGVLRVSPNNSSSIGDTLVATTDGGDTWRELRLPSDAYVYAADYEDASDLWLFLDPPGWHRGDPGPNDWLYHSADGGASWSLVQRNTPIGFSPTLLWFLDPKDGFVVQTANDGSGNAQLFVTRDGGHSWQQVHMTLP